MCTCGDRIFHAIYTSPTVISPSNRLLKFYPISFKKNYNLRITTGRGMGCSASRPRNRLACFSEARDSIRWETRANSSAKSCCVALAFPTSISSFLHVRAGRCRSHPNVDHDDQERRGWLGVAGILSVYCGEILRKDKRMHCATGRASGVVVSDRRL